MPITTRELKDQFIKIAEGRHGDPFVVLGPHLIKGRTIIRAFQPQATSLQLADSDGNVLAEMRKSHDAGMFEAHLQMQIKIRRIDANKSTCLAGVFV